MGLSSRDRPLFLWPRSLGARRFPTSASAIRSTRMPPLSALPRQWGERPKTSRSADYPDGQEISTQRAGLPWRLTP